MKFLSINRPFCTLILYTHSLQQPSLQPIASLNTSHFANSHLLVQKSKVGSSQVRISPATGCPCRHTTSQFCKAPLYNLPPEFDSLRFLQSSMVKSLAKRNPQNSIEKMQPHFKGARMRKWGKWVSEVRMPHSKGKGKIWLGSYDTAEQAARAFDCAVFCLRGSNANFNFPSSLPEIQSASSLSPPQIRAVAAKFAVEEFRQPLEYSNTFSGLKSQLCVESEESTEEQNWILLDSLLEEAESEQSSSNLENFPLFGDSDFVLLE